MTFLALGTAYVFHGHAVHLPALQVLVEFLIDAVELVTSVARAVGEVDLCGTVTVDTPAHAQGSELFYFIHFLDRTVAGLALYLAGLGVLRVAEEYVVRQAVDLDPFNRLGGSCIVAARFGIVAGVGVQFLDLGCSVYFAAVFAVQDRKSVV